MIALHMLTVLLADYLSYIQVCSMIFGPLKLLIFMWYLKTIRHEAKMLSKILIAPTLAASDVHSSSQQGGEEQHKSTNYIRKRIVCQVPDPVPVQQLLHFNAFQTIWMNVNKKDQRSVQMHRSLFEPNHYRPVITFFGKTPIVTFASVDACKTILTKWREFPKDPIMLSDDVHRFVGRNVVFVNGDEWKRQRSVMNPAFNDIPVLNYSHTRKV
ncbi:hypothetical protein C9374_008204 [Naegleria lovaniensis]|uniref:Cytochrome P450 n=1 Tax=Naegleria lovaniensis TaxID=51637 RepID=A0AA88KGE3_NAELO|nr:uncharacterized protein C9374_008204 [Naegleria lovaniensis]KAG2378565.1 hypothetical protein C9374_008204 [Naegleria lovaniensis]